MTVLRTLVVISAIFVFGLCGWLGMAHTLTFKQTDCTYSPESKYVWIKLHNGVEEKGLSFVSDGVIFDSALFGMSMASSVLLSLFSPLGGLSLLLLRPVRSAGCNETLPVIRRVATLEHLLEHRAGVGLAARRP